MLLVSKVYDMHKLLWIAPVFSTSKLEDFYESRLIEVSFILTDVNLNPIYEYSTPIFQKIENLDLILGKKEKKSITKNGLYSEIEAIPSRDYGLSVYNIDKLIAMELATKHSSKERLYICGERLAHRLGYLQELFPQIFDFIDKEVVIDIDCLAMCNLDNTASTFEINSQRADKRNIRNLNYYRQISEVYQNYIKTILVKN